MFPGLPERNPGLELANAFSVTEQETHPLPRGGTDLIAFEPSLFSNTLIEHYQGFEFRVPRRNSSVGGAIQIEFETETRNSELATDFSASSSPAWCAQ
jgi:hypothetical protein